MSTELVNGLWIGSELSKVEQLTIRSFMDNGHSFRLWIYDEAVRKYVPGGAIIADANNVIPASRIFNYAQRNKYGHGKGSYAGFSDIFRYQLLYKYGGWWVDMDVTCLKPLDFDGPYFFRSHHELMLVGNVMKCPQGSDVMLRCYEEAVLNVTAENTDWHKPIEILCSNVSKAGLEKYIVAGVSNHDRWDETSRYIKSEAAIPTGYYFLHWQNEEWRHRMVDKSVIRIRSTLGKLMQKHGLLKESFTTAEMLANTFYLSDFYTNLKLLGIVKQQ
jgi:hypothetical protein